jgi:FMN phosphatase YigB (HAD superfamily)
MNYLLSNDFEWKNIKSVGFDIDGTLYDEFDFIDQVYEEISEIFKDYVINIKEIKIKLLHIWLEKGSSYPYIFKEIVDELIIDSINKECLIDNCLRIFRNFVPNIQLTERAKFLLNDLSSSYELFVVTDGSSLLQWNKINSLKLDQYVSKKNIIVTGDYGILYSKPSTLSISKLHLFNNNRIDCKQVVFIGDREVDLRFADNTGFHFLDIKNLYIKF